MVIKQKARVSIVLLALLVFFTIFITNASAVCVPTIVGTNFSVDETVTITVTCGASDKNDPGFFVFFNSSNGDDTMDDTSNVTFTVPSNSPFVVFPTWKVTANQSPQVNLTGVLFVNDALISDIRFNTTSTGGKNTIDIINVEITDEIFEGRTAGITGIVQIQGKKVGYADICLDVLDENNEPFQHIGCKKSEVDGEFFFSARCDQTNWCTASTSYIIDIDASCPKNSTSYVSCINEDGDELDFATGKRSAPFTVVDMADRMIIPKRYNASIFGVYMRNQFGAKVQMRKNPAFVAQEDIDWLGFNNTNTTFNVNQTGEAYLTSGELASICMLVNNTFPDELEIELSDIHFDDDTLQQLFHPLDPQTKEVLRNIDLASFGVKPFSDEGILAEKCSDQFIIPMNIKGANDWDVNFHYVVEDFVQLIEAESEEFHIYGQVRGQDFVPIVDIKNVTTSVFGTDVNACTDINVTMNYDYFGVTERAYVIIYEFEETTNDVEIGREIKMISPDIGLGNNITQTLTLPFTDNSGEAEVVITIWNNVISLGGQLVGFGDTEPHNTFNITADLSDTCRYQQTTNQFLIARQTRALETSAGASLTIAKNNTEFFNQESIGISTIDETALMQFFINVTKVPTNGDRFKVTYRFYAREGNGTLVDEIETFVDGTLANHSVFLRSTNLKPNVATETYRVTSTVSMQNINGIFEDFTTTTIGLLIVVSAKVAGEGGVGGGSIGQAGLYDVIVKTLADKYEIGNNVKARITIKNLGDIPDQDTILVYYLTDPRGNKFGETQEQFLEVPIGETILIKDITLPSNSVLGEWKFNVEYHTVVQPLIFVFDSFEVVEQLSIIDKITAFSQTPVVVVIGGFLGIALFALIVIAGLYFLYIVTKG